MTAESKTEQCESQVNESSQTPRLTSNMPASQADILATFNDISSAYLSNPTNRIDTSELPQVLHTIRTVVLDLIGQVKPENEPIKLKPSVNPAESVFKDYLICLEDGKQFKTLKGHLRSCHNMTPDEYRNKWKLPSDYPMVAPSYREKRIKLASKTNFTKGHEKKKKRNAIATPQGPITDWQS